MSDWSVYMIRAADGSLYTGVATDVERRLAEHEDGGARGARYLRGRGPLEVVYRVRIGKRGLALRVEGRLKGLAKLEKEGVVRESPGREELLEELGVAEP